MQSGNSRRCWFHAAGQLNSMLCALKNGPIQMQQRPQLRENQAQDGVLCLFGPALPQCSSGSIFVFVMLDASRVRFGAYYVSVERERGMRCET